MSQFNLTANERVVALQRFGYSEREAQFLSTAALHSGYFLRSQFGQFLGSDNSESATETLVEKIFDNCHAAAIAFDRETHLYHLCARSFYAALGEEDNRNRRRRECSTMKNKVMGLDFILAHPGATFLATEHEKVRDFMSVQGIAQSQLPAKIYGSAEGAKITRFFVEKYPIFHLQNGPVSLCFVDEGQTTPSYFKTFLADPQT